MIMNVKMKDAEKSGHGLKVLSQYLPEALRKNTKI
jgi:hypothetical protein